MNYTLTYNPGDMVAVTGHRPEKIDDEEYVREWLRESIEKLQPCTLYVGMASGVDLWAGLEALDLGAFVVACKPWAGHKPRKADVEAYERIIREAIEVFEVSPSKTYPGAWIYQKRNEFMVDSTDRVLAVWNTTTGGTANCINYAIKQKKPIKRLDPFWGDTYYWKEDAWVAQTVSK